MPIQTLKFGAIFSAKFVINKMMAMAAKIKPSKISSPVTPLINSDLTLVFLGIILTITSPLISIFKATQIFSKFIYIYDTTNAIKNTNKMNKKIIIIANNFKQKNKIKNQLKIQKTTKNKQKFIKKCIFLLIFSIILLFV